MARRIALGDEKHIVGRIDDANEGRTTFPAFELIALEPAGVDIGVRIAAEIKTGPAFGTLRSVARRYGRKFVMHRQPSVAKLSGDAFVTDGRK